MEVEYFKNKDSDKDAVNQSHLWNAPCMLLLEDIMEAILCVCDLVTLATSR